MFHVFFFLTVVNRLRPGAPPQTPPLRGAFCFCLTPPPPNLKRGGHRRKRRAGVKEEEKEEEEEEEEKKREGKKNGFEEPVTRAPWVRPRQPAILLHGGTARLPRSAENRGPKTVT